MTEKIDIPKFYAMVEVPTELDCTQVAARVGAAIGVTFEEDMLGLFEELNALVADMFQKSIGVYEGIRDGPNRDFGRIIYVSLRDTFYPSDFGLDVNNCESVPFFLSEFLASLLRSRTGLPFRASRDAVSRHDGLDENTVPELRARLSVNTTKSLSQISARVGAALGAIFGLKTLAQDEGPYAGWYGRTADLLRHRIGVYTKEAPYTTPLPRRVMLDLRPVFSLEDLDQGEGEYTLTRLTISDYLSAILSEDTDLHFRPMDETSS